MMMNTDVKVNVDEAVAGIRAEILAASQRRRYGSRAQRAYRLAKLALRRWSTRTMGTTRWWLYVNEAELDTVVRKIFQEM